MIKTNLKTQSPHKLLFCGTGRLGNQLLSFAHLLAWQQEYRQGLRIINLGFWPYRKFFRLTEHNPACIVPSTTRMWGDCTALIWEELPFRWLLLPWAQHLLRKLAANLPGWQSISVDGCRKSIPKEKELKTLDLADGTLDQVCNIFQTTILAGWRIRNWEILNKHWNNVRSMLRPVEKIEQLAIASQQKLREKSNFIIGIHIRQGDYWTWNDGKYYYTLDQYSSIIEQCRLLYKDRNPIFLITGTEEAACLTRQADCFLSDQSSVERAQLPVINLLELSLCDLIIGPPSVFSFWAFMIGNASLLPVLDPNLDIALTTSYKHYQEAIACSEFRTLVLGG
ncbi:MAG: hypothetical protein K2W82_14365 [Candidatus Obscuribacterales bacterium]|nr:hypothetical protein [Candidatus Obscuribacterales bacterium]